MNKKTIFSILISGVSVFLTGCTTLSHYNPLLLHIKDPSKHLTEQKNSIFINNKDEKLRLTPLTDGKKSYGLKILADQVLGPTHGCKNIPNPYKNNPDIPTSKKTKDAVSQPKYYEPEPNLKDANPGDANPLSSKMAKSGTMKELMRTQCGTDRDLEVGYFDLKEFIEAMHIEYIRAFADDDVRNNISNAQNTQQGGLIFSKVLLTYARAYYKGEFTLRNGAKLAKPSTDIGFDKDGAFIISTDNDTLIGLTTVFLEALSEFAFPTKVIIGATNKPTFEKEYRERKKFPQKHGTADEDRCLSKKSQTADDIFCDLIYKRKDVTDYLTDSNFQPTVLTLDSDFFKNNCEITKEDCLVNRGEKGVSQIEFDALQFIPGYVAHGSKMVLGTTLRSVGGLGVSFGAFGKFSIGDNDALSKVVETAIEVLSRRLLEYNLYHFLMDEEFENELEHFFGN